MFPPQFIIQDRIERDIVITSKKRLLEVLARLLASGTPDRDFSRVFERLLERERLGSTGLGYGIALPHARMRGIPDAIGAFVRLREGVDFDAPDHRPVDLAFAILVPESATEAHLQLLSQLAILFDDPEFRRRLRAAKTSEGLLALLRDPDV